MVLFLPHPLRSSRKAFGRVPRKYVLFFSYLRSKADRSHAVPNSVLGGVTTFLFASVATSGVRVLAYVKYTRRDRFIIAAALCFGFGDLLVPDIFTHLFDGVDNPSSGLRGLLDAIEIILTTPCECGPPSPRELLIDRYNSPARGFGCNGAEPDFTPRGKTSRRTLRRRTRSG
jgi:hypothetical protein